MFKIFKYNDSEDLPLEVLEDFIDRHKQERLPRLQENHNYLTQKSLSIDNEFLEEEREGKFVGKRHKTNLANIIVNTQYNYLFGSGISYKDTSAEDDNEDFKIFEDIRSSMNMKEKEGEMVLNGNKYGLSYSLIYTNQDDNITWSTLDAKECFVIYSYDLEPEPIWGVRYFEDYNEELIVEVYGKQSIYKYKDGQLIDRKPNNYNICQMVEHKNNEYMYSDFEPVKGHIDDLNKTITTESNLIHYINNALLIFKNIDLDQKDITKMVKNGALKINSGMDGVEADVSFLEKPLNVAGIKQHLDILLKSAFRDSFTPLVTSDELTTAPSGKALEALYMITDLVSSVKEKEVRKSIKRIIRIIFSINNFSKLEGINDFDYIEPNFTRTLPALTSSELEDILKIIQSVHLSEKTKLELIPNKYIDDADREIKRKQEEVEQFDYNVLDDEEEGE